MVPGRASPSGSTRSAGRPASSAGVRRTPAGTGNDPMNAAKPSRIRSTGTGPNGCGALRSVASRASRWSLLMWPPGGLNDNCMLRHISCRVYAMAFTSANEGLAGFFDDLVRCETRLYNAIGEKLRAEHGIVASQFEFLRYLRDHPRSRVADVAATFAARIGAISKMTDRREARGWAARLPNPADRRSSLISLTASGAALVAEAERTFNDLLDELVIRTALAQGIPVAIVLAGGYAQSVEDTLTIHANTAAVAKDVLEKVGGAGGWPG